MNRTGELRAYTCRFVRLYDINDKKETRVLDKSVQACVQPCVTHTHARASVRLSHFLPYGLQSRLYATEITSSRTRHDLQNTQRDRCRDTYARACDFCEHER